MISVIVSTLNDEARLAACLSPLVTASMAGLVRELVIVDAGSSDATLEIADDAGAKIIRSSEGVSAGVKAAKGPWLLVLDPGVRLDYGWAASVERHISASREAARFRLYTSEGGWLSRLFAPKRAAVLFLKEAYDRSGGFGAGGGRPGRLGRCRLLDARGAV